jgi:hypothetical protein
VPQQWAKRLARLQPIQELQRPVGCNQISESSCCTINQVRPTASEQPDRSCCRRVAQPRPAIERQVQWSVEIDDLGLLCDEQRRRDPKRRADHATDHDPQAPPLRFRRQRERLGQPTHFVELDIDGLVFPVEPVEIGTVRQDSSAQSGIGCSNRAGASSAWAGSGCSISATLKSMSIGMYSPSWRSFQLSLASTMRRAAGAACRTARTRSTSPSPPVPI